LRAVGASVMPRLAPSNASAATVVIAQKAADTIRADHRSRGTPVRLPPCPAAASPDP